METYDECFVCKKRFTRISRHLHFSESCLDDYPIAKLARLRKQILKRSKENKKQYQKKYQKEYHIKNRPKRLQQRKQLHKRDGEDARKNFYLKKQLFFDDIKYGPIFTCVCCNRDMFECGVNVVTEDFVNDLKQNALDMYIRLDSELKFHDEHYVCKNCYKILKYKKKMPAICFRNGLGLSEVPDSLKLTDLENQLVSKNLVFLKIKPLPRNRYSAMMDRIVNVPIPDDEIIKTVNSLPRQADTSGLISVQLKRKLEYKNVHNEEKIRPNKLKEAVCYLKDHHPSYYDIQIIENDQQSSKEEEAEKDSDVEVSQDEAMDISEDEDNEPNSSSDNEDDEHNSSSDSEEQEPESIYNDVTCIVRDEPATELYVNTTNKIVSKKPKLKSSVTHQIAPGEGKICTNWMRDENFDIEAFPIHHSDGKYGLNYPREVKLHPHQYYSQRAMNHDKRWSQDASFLFVGQQYTERYALEREIGVSLTKGSMKYDGESAHISHVENSFSILKKIPGTPSYWRVFRNDIMAKIEQVGQFHMFFTLSCAEKRWPEILAAILQLEGNKLSFNLPWDGKEDSIFINDEPLSEFKKSVNWSEKLRKSIMLITQMFDSRVKAFVKNILMKSGIDLYAYRLEWQIRGMPHIHGVLWFEASKLRNLIDKSTGSFICNDELIKFIDKWVSVSLTNTNEELNQLVREVNCHHHTDSCKKYDGNCRYGFPRFPSDKTMFAISPSLLDEEEEEERKDTIKKAKNLLAKVKEKLEIITEEEEKLSVRAFLDKLDIQEDKYYEALAISERGTNIILKRSLKERNVNNYNPEFMLVWQANMDIQFCTDTYAVITYITDYMTKADKGFEKLLETVLKQTPSSDHKERLNNLKKIYFMNRQISSSEAIYRLLPTLNMKGSNLKTKFVTSGFPQNRSIQFLPKQQKETENENSEDDEEDENVNNDRSYSISGREGKYKKVDTVHEKYERRPLKLNDMCLALFATTYESGQKPKKAKFVDQVSEEKLEPDNVLPKWIVLNDGKCMKARGTRAVLRIHSSKKKKDYEEHYSELLLFFPWRNEYEDLHPDDPDFVTNLYVQKLEIIIENRQLLLPYSAMVKDMKEQLENGVDMRPTHIGDKISSTMEQENEDDMEIDVPFDDCVVVADEDHGNKSIAKDVKFKIPLVDDDDTMLNLARSLSKAQRMVFDKFVDYVKKVKCHKKIISHDFSPPMMIATGK